MTEIIFNTAIVFVCFVALVAIGLRIMNAMMDDAEPEKPVEPPRPKEWTSDYVRDNIHKLKPPPEPEH